jgi:hypothetical protein
MKRLGIRAWVLILGLAACGEDDGGTEPPPPPPGELVLTYVSGRGQSGAPGEPLTAPLVVRVLKDGVAEPAVEIAWEVIEGGGSVSPTETMTGADGRAQVTFTLGVGFGPQVVRARIPPDGTPIEFDAQARAQMPAVGGGDNVPERYTSDLWLHGDYAYTGTWGSRGANVGNALKVWQLNPAGAPVFVRDVLLSIGTVSDVEVTLDGALLLATAEGGADPGLHLFSLVDPSNPIEVDFEEISGGLHTGTFAEIGGKRYVFAAKNPGSSNTPALRIFEIDPVAADPIVPVTSVPIPPSYGIHDTFVRDGLAFVSAWNTGLIIYDVGNGIEGGSPSNPIEVSRIITASNGVPGGAQVHNSWWFHNPVTDEQRYVFVGQEGPGSIGGSASGDLHVVDLSNIQAPVEVASLRIPGAGIHNLWMDEDRQILYAAWYNAGVVEINVAGELTGDLTDRIIAQTDLNFTWSVMLHDGYLYASDMVSGLWQLTPP